MRTLLLTVALLAAVGAACGDDPTSVSLSGTTTTEGVRTTTTAAGATTSTTAAAAAVQRGCSATRPSSTGWAGASVDPTTGVAPVDAFNAYLVTARAPVTTSPCDAAKVFVRADTVSGSADVSTEVSPDDAASANVTVTIDGLEDDSVAAARWVLQFAEQPDGTIRLAAAQLTTRCQAGRGHQDFSTALCA